MKKRKFKNKELIDFLYQSNQLIEEYNNGVMFRINRIVDIYKNSNNVFCLPNKQWVVTTPDTIKEIVLSMLCLYQSK